MLDTGITLKTVKQTEYNCALCAAGYEPTLDEIVEVTFTVSSRIRSIAAHHPETLPWIEEVFVTTIARARASRDGQVLTFVDK